METRSKTKTKVHSSTSKEENSRSERPKDVAEKQKMSRLSTKISTNNTYTLCRKKLEAQVKEDEEMATLMHEEEELSLKKLEYKKQIIENK